MDDGSPAERELALFMGMVLLTKCEQVWVFGSVISAGMRGGDCEGGKEEHTGAVFHRGIGGDAMRELNIACANSRSTKQLTNKKIAKATHEAFTVEERNLLLRYAQEGNNLFMRDETGAFVPGLDIPGYPLFGIFNGFPRYFTDSVERSGARIFDQTMITDIVVEDGACIGAVGLHVPTGTVRVFRAKSTVSCTGASSWIYGWNTVAPTSINSPDNTGDVDAAAFSTRCGSAGFGVFSIRPHQHVSDGACGDVRRRHRR